MWSLSKTEQPEVEKEGTRQTRRWIQVERLSKQLLWVISYLLYLCGMEIIMTVEISLVSIERGERAERTEDCGAKVCISRWWEVTWQRTINVHLPLLVTYFSSCNSFFLHSAMHLFFASFSILLCFFYFTSYYCWHFVSELNKLDT